MKIFLRIIYIKIVIFHFVTAQSQVIEKKFEIDSNQTIIFQYEGKHLIKIIDKRMAGDSIYGYHFCFTKSRLDSIWLDFNPDYTLIVSDKKDGVKVINNMVTKDNLVPFVQENTRRILSMYPNYVYNGGKCNTTYMTNSRIIPGHFVEITYSICKDGQIVSIKENYYPVKNGIEMLISGNNFIKSIETYKNDTLDGVHIVFKKNGKLKFMFICVDGVRYNMMSYNQVLMLSK